MLIHKWFEFICMLWFVVWYANVFLHRFYSSVNYVGY